jgi:hypothetical protein
LTDGIGMNFKAGLYAAAAQDVIKTRCFR